MAAVLPSIRALPEGDALVRASLKLDAVVTAANGVAYLAAANVLDGVLGPSAATLRGIGAFLVLFAAGVWLAGRPERPSRAAVWTIAEANLGWAAASVAVVAAGALSLTTAGSVWTVLQAAVVGGFAALQIVALHRAR